MPWLFWRSRSSVSPFSVLVLVFRMSIGVAVLNGFSPSSYAGPGALPSDNDIRRLLVKRIDEEKQSLGIVVGILDAKGRRIVSHGILDKSDRRPLDGNTLFEIGSITKVFTALLLTDMAERGEVRLDDPIQKYLPANVKMPERNGRQITLVDLATNTSGLPLMPMRFRSKNPENPFFGYTEDKLYSFLSSYQLHGDIGSTFEYSNVGFGLLGLGLAHEADSDFEVLIEARICLPLGMRSTRITLTPALQARLVPGHSADLLTVSRWDNPTLAGASALVSSTNDLLTFLSAMMGVTRSRLTPAMASMLSVIRPTGQPLIDTGLGWTVDTRVGNRIIWRNGRTGGFRSFIGYAPSEGVGIVVLSNTSYGNFGIDDIGLHLLDSRYPLGTTLASERNSRLTDADAAP